MVIFPYRNIHITPLQLSRLWVLLVVYSYRFLFIFYFIPIFGVLGLSALFVFFWWSHFQPHTMKLRDTASQIKSKYFSTSAMYVDQLIQEYFANLSKITLEALAKSLTLGHILSYLQNFISSFCHFVKTSYQIRNKLCF